MAEQQTPAGWYPTPDGQQRYWDGNRWTEHVAPGTGTTTPAATAPTAATPGAPYGTSTPGATHGTGIPGATPPPKKDGALKWVLITIGVVLVLGVGSCVAFVATVGREVNKAIDSATSLPTSLGDGGDTTDPDNSDQSGDRNNPVEITEGTSFDIRGFTYSDGWEITSTPIGMSIDNLEVTNNRDNQDSALVDIRFWKGSEVLASLNCASEPIDPGTTATVTCISGDEEPGDYDRITIQDMF